MNQQKPTTTGAIVTTTTNNNYGNVIQRWALQKFLANHGYYFISYYFYGYYLRKYLIRQTIIFAPLRWIVLTLKGRRKNYIRSSSLYNYAKLSKFCHQRINQRIFLPFFRKKYQNYIVGSDQVFHYRVISGEFLFSWKNFLLSFVKWPAKRISYAPSFAKNTIPDKSNPLTSTEAKSLIKKFDAISIREQSGVEIAKKIWGISPKQVVDPTLLLEAQDYQDLIRHSTSSLHKVEPVFYFILRDDTQQTLQNFAKKSAKKINKKIDGILGYNYRDLPAMEQWLKGFSEAELAITDSFHGTVFSIINHTNFLVLRPTSAKESGSSARYEDLLTALGIKGHLVGEEDFDNFDITKLPQINWAGVDKKLAKLRKDSSDWLLSQLTK